MSDRTCGAKLGGRRISALFDRRSRPSPKCYSTRNSESEFLYLKNLKNKNYEKNEILFQTPARRCRQIQQSENLTWWNTPMKKRKKWGKQLGLFPPTECRKTLDMPPEMVAKIEADLEIRRAKKLAESRTIYT